MLPGTAASQTQSAADSPRPAGPRGPAASPGAPAVTPDARLDFDIPAGPLDAALDRFARAAGVNLSFDAQLAAGRSTHGVSGRLDAAAALSALLAGSDVEAIAQPGGGYVLRRKPVSGVGAPAPGALDERSGNTLPAVSVHAPAWLPGDLPHAYAGGQVARGGGLGLLGDRDVLDTPFSQTNFTAQTLRNDQARTVVDVLANDPSVRAAWSDMSYTSAPMIRGFLVSPWDFSLNGTYGAVPGLSFVPDSVERVEVLHGPSALLNGMPPLGSVGGTINLVPKRATDQPVASLTATYASDNQLGGHVDLGRRFGPLHQWGIRLNATYHDGNTPTDHQSQRLTAASIGADYRGERLRVELDLGYQQLAVQSPLRPTYLKAGIAVPTAPRADANWFQPWTYAHAQDAYGALRGEFDLSEDWHIHAVYGGRRNRSYLLTGFATISGANGDLTEAPYNFPVYHDSDSQELGLQGRVNTGPVTHRLAFTTNRVHDESGAQFPVVATIASNLYDPVFVGEPAHDRLNAPRTSATDLKSFGFADTMSVADDRFQVIWGLRQQRIEARNFNGATGAVTSRYDKAAVTPTLALIYKPLRDLSVYASYIEGLQAGAVVGASYANAGEVLPAYVSRQYEAGVKKDWGSVTTTLALFQITQSSGTADTTTIVYGADGRQRNRGIEFNAFGQLTRSVRVLGGVTLLDGVLLRTANGTYDGNTAPSVPHVQFNLSGEWDVPGLAGLTLSGRAIATSSQYYDNTNTQQIPGWARFDIGARYATTAAGRPLTLRANVINVANRGYWASANPTYGLTLGSPRTVLLSATVDF